MDELDELLKQQYEIQQRIIAARLKKQEEEYRIQQEKLKKGVVIDVNEVINDKYVSIILSENRADVLSILRYVYNRTYTQGEKQNSIPIKYWQNAIKQIEALPNVSIQYGMGVQDAIEKIINGPRFNVSIGDGKLIVKVNEFASEYAVSLIPSAKKMSGYNSYELILAEAFMVPEALKDEKVEYTDEAIEYISKQIELRNKLDLIAQKETSEIKVPLADGVTLFDFQKVGVEFIEEADGNAIEGDEMGLGKTPQAIGFVEKRGLRALVLAPATLKTNWYRAIKKFTGKEATILQGTIPDQLDIIKMMIDKPQWTIMNYDMIAKRLSEVKEDVDSKTGFVKKTKIDKWYWVDLINLSQFDIIILDESHYVKNVGSLRSQASRLLQSPRFLCLTGTPVLNRPSELWALLALVAPKQFPNYEQFVLRYTHDGKEPRNVDELRKLIKPLMIRRLKKDVLKELPPINRQYEFHDLSSEAQRKYNMALEGVYEVIKTYNPSQAGEQWKITSILAELMRLKQIAADDKIEHTSDIVTEALDSADPDDPNHKVIVFSQFQGAVHALSNRLAEEGVVSFTGEDPMWKRTEAQDEFQNNPNIKVLVTTPKVAGEGLNLTRAGTVVFNDLGWTPATHEQAEARAYGRMSDLHSITSKYVVASNTIEDWIQELLETKLRIITEVVDGVQLARDEDSSIVSEIIKRLKGLR